MAYPGSFSFDFRMSLWVKRLLIANIAVGVLTLVAPVSAYLAFTPAEVLFRPWTIVTYMFVHGDFWHLFFNMLVLFFFGPPLEERWGSREFLKYYLVCGIGAALLGFIFALHTPVIGASGAIYGLMLAFAMLWPNAPIYFWGIFPIPAKWLVGGLAVLTFFFTVTGGGGTTAHFAHLGGFVAGFLYLKLEDPLRIRLARIKKALPRSRLTVVSGGQPQPATDGPRRLRRREEERLLDEVDRVLDKISNSGLASLTAEERKLLDEVSRRYRRN